MPDFSGCEGRAASRAACGGANSRTTARRGGRRVEQSGYSAHSHTERACPIATSHHGACCLPTSPIAIRNHPDQGIPETPSVPGVRVTSGVNTDGSPLRRRHRREPRNRGTTGAGAWRRVSSPTRRAGEVPRYGARQARASKLCRADSPQSARMSASGRRIGLERGRRVAGIRSPDQDREQVPTPRRVAHTEQRGGRVEQRWKGIAGAHVVPVARR